MKESLLGLYIKTQRLKVLVTSQSGQDLIEYALVVALIALAATASMQAVTSAIATAFTAVGTKLGTYTS